MNYKLAKQLLTRGFPQDKCKWFYVNTKEIRVIDWAYPYDGSAFEPDNKSIAIPTLEELIEVLGDEFKSLDKLGDGTFGAWSWLNGGEHGKNPKETVAKLFIKLNATKTNNKKRT